MRGFFLLLPSALLALATAAPAGDLIPWFSGSDPKVRWTLYIDEIPDLVDKRVVVFPFEVRQQVRPLPPRLKEHFLNSLAAHAEVRAAMAAERTPWAGESAPRVERMTVAARLERLAAQAARDELDVVVWGRIHQIRRTSSDGLKTDVEVWLVDLTDPDASAGQALPAAGGAAPPRIVWHVRKQIEWKRHYPLDECLALLADKFVWDWVWE